MLQFPCNQIVGKKYCMKITKCFSQLLKMSGNYSFRNANSWILDTLTRSLRNSVTVTTVKASKCSREIQACFQLSGVGLFSTVSCRSVFNCQVHAGKVFVLSLWLEDIWVELSVQTCGLECCLNGAIFLTGNVKTNTALTKICMCWFFSTTKLCMKCFLLSLMICICIFAFIFDQPLKADHTYFAAMASAKNEGKTDQL